MNRKMIAKVRPYAAGYIRYSTDLQESDQAQKTLVQKRAEIMGIELPEDAVYFDEALSRDFFLRRDGLQALLKRIEDPNCTTVIVNWFDRLYTSDNQKEIFAAFRRAKVRVFDSEGRERNTGSHEGELVDYLDAWLSKGVVQGIRQKVHDTHKAKAMSGRFVGKPPYGISVVSVFTLPCKGTCIDGGKGCPVVHGERSKKDTVWIVNAEQVAILRMMYEWVADGMKVYRAAERLEEMGLGPGVKTTKKGKHAGRLYGGQPWSKHNVRRMLQNEFYKGVLIWGRFHTEHDGDIVARVKQPEESWIVNDHCFGEIIPADLWDRAQAMIRLRTHTRDEGRVYPTLLFDSFLRCGRCGWKMYPRRRHYTRSSWEAYDYVCVGAYQPYSSCTENHTVPAHWLLPELDRALHGAEPDKATVALGVTDGSRDRTQEVALLQQELASIPGQLANIKKLAIKGVLDADEALAERTALEAQQRVLTAQIAELASPQADELPEDARRWLAEYATLLADDRVPVEDRRVSLARVLDRVVVDRGSEVEISFQFLSTDPVAEAA